MIKYVFQIDYARGEKRGYMDWVRSIADTLQAPSELKELASYDSVFSESPQRVVEFTFASMADAAAYFDRPEMVKIFQGELAEHAARVNVSVLKLLSDYNKGF